jgi:hypothetical protein
VAFQEILWLERFKNCKKSHFFVSGKQNVFHPSVIFGIAMNKFEKWTGCRERSRASAWQSLRTAIKRLKVLCVSCEPARCHGRLGVSAFPLFAFRFCSSGNPLRGAEMQSVAQINAFLTPLNASATKFNGLCNARFSKINAH